MKTSVLLTKLKTTESPAKEDMTLMLVLELLLGLPLVQMVRNILTKERHHHIVFNVGLCGIYSHIIGLHLTQGGIVFHILFCHLLSS